MSERVEYGLLPESEREFWAALGRALHHSRRETIWVDPSEPQPRLEWYRTESPRPTGGHLHVREHHDPEQWISGLLRDDDQQQTSLLDDTTTRRLHIVTYDHHRPHRRDDHGSTRQAPTE